MNEQPNKPAGDFKDNGKVRDAGDEQAVKNQATVSPDDYPKGKTDNPEVTPGKEKE